MNALEVVVDEAAAATSIQELGMVAFRSLAAAIHAGPGFFVEVDARGLPLRPIAGDVGGSLETYITEYITEDPLGVIAMTTPATVSHLQRHVDPRAMRASRAYDEFHRVLDLEHHVLARCRGARALAPGAVTMGFTRGRRGRPFDDHDLERAAIGVAAFRGAVRRIGRATCPLDDRGLTPAEARVIELLSGGLSNADIAGRLGVSVATVKTHLHRSFDKLGVRSRAQAIALVRSR